MVAPVFLSGLSAAQREKVSGFQLVERQMEMPDRAFPVVRRLQYEAGVGRPEHVIGVALLRLAHGKVVA